MKFTEKDIAKGYAICDQGECNKKHILQAGMDYPDKCWVKCDECHCFVVDEGREG